MPTLRAKSDTAVGGHRDNRSVAGNRCGHARIAVLTTQRADNAAVSLYSKVKEHGPMAKSAPARLRAFAAIAAMALIALPFIAPALAQTAAAPTTPSVAPAAPAPTTEAPSTPPSAATPAPSDVPAGQPTIGRSLLPQNMSPWGMFMNADLVVKAVIIGLAFASLVT